MSIRPAANGKSIQPIKPSGGIKPAGAAIAAKKPLGATLPNLIGKTPTFSVRSNSKDAELGLPTLVGDFVEAGSNHGRKYYQKNSAIPGHPGVKVFLYYWDQRDGADFSGWWFGDQLGGSEVWARCNSHGNIPPQAGWKVPWNALKAEPGLLTVLPHKGGDRPAVNGVGNNVNNGKIAAVTPKPAVKLDPALAESIKKASSQVEAVEKSARVVVAKSKALNKDTATIAAISEVQASLQEEQSKLSEAQKALTGYINDARKAGPSAVASVTELSKLSPRLRVHSSSVNTELNRLKGLVEAAKLNDPEVIKKTEEENEKEMEKFLPDVKKACEAACDAVESIGTVANPLLEDTDTDAEVVKASLEDIEKTALAAQTQLQESRQQINAKLQAARSFAPEARKKALAELTSLQTKLGEATKQLQPFKTFKKDFTVRVAAKKALKDLVEKLGAAELEVEKASMMAIGTDSGSQMSEEDIKSAQELITPAKSALANVGKLLNAKFQTASGPMRDELSTLRGRHLESEKRINEIASTVTRQKEGLQLQEVFKTAHEKVDKSDESLKKCGDAELSFLKGIEVLPEAESEKAIKDSESASAEATTAVQQAKSFLQASLAKVRQYSKETVKSATDELMELKKKNDELEKRLMQFKSDTRERKVNAIMSEAIDAVQAAEGKKAAVIEATKVLTGDLENTTVEALKEGIEKATAAEKEIATALIEARKMIQTKQKESQDQQLHQGLTKLNGRLGVVQAEASKAKRAIASGEQLVQGKVAANEADTKITAIEADVEKLSKMANPGDEGLGIEKISDETILEIEKLGSAAATSIKEVTAAVQPHMSAGASIRSVLTKLIERTRKAQTTIAEAKAGTKEQRERVLSENYVKEGEEKVKELENTSMKIDSAEAPYLKGVEVLPHDESTKAMAEADEANKAVQAGISSARQLIAAKNLEMKKFDAKNAKDSLDAFVKLSERVNATAQKLNTFKKDTEKRKKKVLLQEAAEKVKSLQADAEKVAEAMKAITEKDADTLTPEEASTLVKNMDELEKAAQAKVVECRTFLAKRSQEAHGDADDTSAVKELQTKLAAVQTELSKAKKLSNTHNLKLNAKALVQEAGEKIKGMEAELEKVKAACAPLLEEKCERFLVQLSIKTLCKAFQAHMDEEKIDEEAMHKKIGGTVNQDTFVQFVGKVPETLKREECAFSEERRVAMFKSIDKDADGVISLAEFKGMFSARYVVVHGISVTDVFDIATSKVLCKLEVGDVVETYGEAKPGEGDVPRFKCKIIKSGEEGWVTLSSNKGTKYLDTVTPFREFSKELQPSLNATIKFNNEVTVFFNTKAKELSTAAKDSPMATAKEELSKLRAKVVEITGSFAKMRQQVDQAKKDYPSLEQKEINAHIEAKERKEADEVLAPAKSKIDVVEADLKALEEAAKPLTERQQDPDLLMAFGTPISVQDSAKSLDAKLRASVSDAKAVIKERQELVAKAVKGPLAEAKRELSQWNAKAAQSLGAANKVSLAIRSCLNSIAGTKLDLASAAMRADVLSKGTSLEAVFEQLAKEGDRIPEDGFASFLQGLKGLDVSAEHAKLLVRKIESGGVSRRSFMRLLQKYFKVSQVVAITPGFDVVDSKEKPVRKAELSEIFEVLEGPTKDEKSGLERVRIKALRDAAEGWVSVKGNQGKTFLEEVEKPFYYCGKDMALEKDFKTNTENAVRGLKADEVVELLEGPRKEELGSVSRLRGKAISDGKVGWITVKDQAGNEFAEKNDKHYVCTATVAITDIYDIKDCKVLKKLVVDEVIVVSEGPVTDDGGITRVKGKSNKDDTEGWVTIKGNAGTSYLKLNDKLYTAKKDIVMELKFESDSTAVRTLTAGEAIEVLVPAKEEKFQPVNRVKVRASNDRAIGWVTLKNESLRNWRSSGKVSRASPLYTAKGLRESTVRELAAGEFFEVVEVPVDVDGEMWMKVHAKKDSAEGWIPLKDEKGVRLTVQTGHASH